ncbi:hypothetical protein [Phaeobacter sp. B1627]|uniref:hypothetical protein n=1 Tax=Phaeobacter sp. B1627 TaxID=2583809 RepID=UPI00111935B2|nr:hypothetical protein [Phaeobacter sp. B1627]TNJ41788.1 hypothetical protein FGE21_12910 [Phaeobacter sp. B1627]
MPDLIKLYIRSALAGLVLSAVFVGALLALDVGRLGSLILGSDAGVLAAAVLWISNAVVFGGVQFGISVMGIASRDHRPGGGLSVGPELQPVRVRAHISGARSTGRS